MSIPKLGNTFVWDKEKQCSEQGIWPLGIDYMRKNHKKEYHRFIYIDAIVRGPLLPRKKFCILIRRSFSHFCLKLGQRCVGLTSLLEELMRQSN